MHIPDGFLDTKTIVATTTLSAIGIGTAWRQARARMPSTRIPLLGVAAAFVFAAQMLNFPVIGGTSGHLLGAVLASVLLGPGASVIVMTAVLVVQCLLFADGGILALGANIFNMAIVGSIGGYAIYRLCFSVLRGERGRVLSVAFASWCSVVLASLCCAGELSWSGTVSAWASFPAMAGIHALIGLGEGLITSLVIVAIGRVRPDLLESEYRENSVNPAGTFIGYGLLISLGLVVFVSPFASPWPDGLERVAASLGFDRNAIQSTGVPPVLTDYKFPGISSVPLAIILAGTAGVLLAFTFSFLLSKVLTKRTKTRATIDRSVSS